MRMFRAIHWALFLRNRITYAWVVTLPPGGREAIARSADRRIVDNAFLLHQARGDSSEVGLDLAHFRDIQFSQAAPAVLLRSK